jgi:hypothetical protein
MELRAAASWWRFIALSALFAVATGCGSKPPYKVSESRQLSAGRLRALGRIDLDQTAASQATTQTPRVWIGVPDRRAEGTIYGAIIGGAVGAGIGAAAFSGGTGMFANLAILFGAFVVGAPAGVLVGSPIGLVAGTSGEGNRRASRTLREVARSIDVASAARSGARRSSTLAKNHSRAGPVTGHGSGGTLSIDVIAYGTRAAGGGRARPFVAARTRLTESGSGRVLYDTTQDWRGPRKQFHRWADNGGVQFRRWLETGAATLGRQSTRRALTPRRRA